jgi:hypothetical protein
VQGFYRIAADVEDAPVFEMPQARQVHIAP